MHDVPLPKPALSLLDRYLPLHPRSYKNKSWPLLSLSLSLLLARAFVNIFCQPHVPPPFFICNVRDESSAV